MRKDWDYFQIFLYLPTEIFRIYLSYLKWKPDLEIYFQVLSYNAFQIQILLYWIQYF